MNDGIFGLDRPEQLLKKLEYDFQRLRHDQGRETMLYTAFDFFVTAYSLVDWVKKRGALTQTEVDALYAPVLIKLCGDLANGGKHFQLREDKTKTTVTTHSAQPASRDPLHRCAWKPTLSRRVYPLPRLPSPFPA
jgi:hypothetical protein